MQRRIRLGEQVAVAVEHKADRRRHWFKAGNLWYNAAVRTALHTLAASFGPTDPPDTAEAKVGPSS